MRQKNNRDLGNVKPNRQKFHADVRRRLRRRPRRCYERAMQSLGARQPNEIRPIRIVPDFVRFPQGSCLIEVGDTRVICTATVEESVPQFLRDTQRGWVTAEYAMLPGSSQQRIERESSRGKVGGRTQEIQRLIGRSLRSIIEMSKLGPRTIWIDCDVIQADGGTRTASITGAYVALALAVRRLRASGLLAEDPLTGSVAAVSAGIVDGRAVLDLCYEQDKRAEVDMNFVMTGAGALVEVQGTAEGHPFTRAQLDELLDLAAAGIAQLTAAQRAAIESS
jgi:ribonuclease PH